MRSHDAQLTADLAPPEGIVRDNKGRPNLSSIAHRRHHFIHTLETIMFVPIDLTSIGPNIMSRFSRECGGVQLSHLSRDSDYEDQTRMIPEGHPLSQAQELRQE